jgi:hypothetical protein
MEHVKDYRRRAKECRQLATTAAPHHRATIEAISAMWTKMADEREKMLEARDKDKSAE